jgi:hypothetical protein
MNMRPPVVLGSLVLSAALVACGSSEPAASTSGGAGGTTGTGAQTGGGGNGGMTGSGGSAGSTGDGSGGGFAGGGATGGGGSGEGAGPPVSDEDIGGYSAETDWIFSDQKIHAIEITLPQASIDALLADPYTFAPGDFSLDGDALPDVGVRLRGKIGSFRPINAKPKLKIKFNELVPNQRFYGLKALSLNNEVVDCSYLKEPLGYRVFGLAGAPAVRTGFARVTVNGLDYGLYVIIETPDDRFLKRVYADPSGNFYDGKYIWYGGWNYQLLDFNTGTDDMFPLEEGIDVGHADIHAISDAIATWAWSGQFEAGLAPVLDWDEIHRTMAAEQWIGHNDGYALNSNNYRIYFDPADGKADMIPWDLDYAFLHDYDWGMSWGNPKGQIAYHCAQDAGCKATHKTAVFGVLAALDPAALVAWFDQIDALTYADAVSDPRRECGSDQIAPWRAALRSWIATQNDVLAAQWNP